ncbi:DUF2380 domain-containing protein [Desulfofarcimen acetoxidans]|uniref:DUF2380 domain-containing protein n=1 Tax=Desulfofarcimen acetoxidans TaxID=58138 RepID=UPI0030EE7F20
MSTVDPTGHWDEEPCYEYVVGPDYLENTTTARIINSNVFQNILMGISVGDGLRALKFFKGAGRTGIIEQHHLLPQQFKKQFEKAGLDIEKYKIPLDKADHRLKPDGLHTGTNNWNKQWDDFFKQYPEARQDQILNQLDKMMKASGLK